jgi:hypothetical protein
MSSSFNSKVDWIALGLCRQLPGSRLSFASRNRGLLERGSFEAQLLVTISLHAAGERQLDDWPGCTVERTRTAKVDIVGSGTTAAVKFRYC